MMEVIIVDILKNNLWDQISSLEENLRDQLSKSRRELQQKATRISILEKREKAFLKCIYLERCEKESMKNQLNYNRDAEEEIKNEINNYIQKETRESKIESGTGGLVQMVQEAVIRLHKIEGQTTKEEHKEDQNDMLPSPDDYTNETLPPTPTKAFDDSVTTIIELDEEEKEKEIPVVKRTQEAEEENYLGKKTASIFNHLEEILNSDDEESNTTIPSKDLSTSLPQLEDSNVLEEDEEMDLSNNTNSYIEELLQDDTDDLPDTSLIEASISNDVDVFKLLESVYQNSNEINDKDDALDAPMELSSDCDSKQDKKKKRRPIRESWLTRKSQRLTFLGKETTNEALTFKEMSAKFAPKVMSAKKMSRGKLKRAACKQCEKCLREDCGECVNCMDKTKNGGLNRIRQKCIERRCEDMSLYNN